MGILLFKHNQIAYEKVCSMIRKTGKAAVVHPTGTGKSFIAFKFCEANPDKKICWLSPSEYIFETQVENLKETGADVPDNISFYTYSKIIYMQSEDIERIKPDCIILDEFHRCGAEMWGQGVEKLCKTFPQAMLLGLSATHIRYLDNQRNMADELFDGNIASEISLGDAIVRGILNPPKYVLSVFSYQKDLEKYKYRVEHSKNKAIRDAATEYLEALRRALEKADGLDVIFDKHITDRQGKYIVFCSNVEHLHEMMELSAKWFNKVDDKAHYYCAYSENPLTDENFMAFKKDSSEHLKLLFCVDMLNEGIHIDDISGVILLRPTVSPIVYKQQIGRALSAGRKKNAVIFDIVMNIENLYSIGAVEEEMQIAMTYYREQGLADEIVNSQFQVIDEVKDCVELFNKLNNSLNASWDMMYGFAKEYFEENGNLEIPKRYVTKDGYNLGMWINTQRRVYQEKIYGILTPAQIQRLNKIGMDWNSPLDRAWEKYFTAAGKYYQENGNLLINASESYDGVLLGNWISNLRTYKKNDTKSQYLTEDRIQALDEIGMVWDVPDYVWEQNFHEALKYHREYGNLEVPIYYTTKDGFGLGRWLETLRQCRRASEKNNTKSLSTEQIKRLDELGMRWGKKQDRAWQEKYAEAVSYYREHKNLDVPTGYVTENGCHLGKWISNQRISYEKLSKTRIEMLNKIGMRWQKQSPIENVPKTVTAWEKQYADAKEYYEIHGNLNIPNEYIGASGKRTALWLITQQNKYHNGKLSENQILLLNKICMPWKNFDSWEEGFSYAKKYYRKNGNLLVDNKYVDEDGFNLGSWISNQRSAYKKTGKSKLTKEKIEKLNSINMIWDLFEYNWVKAFEDVKAYKEQFGNLNIPKDYIGASGKNLYFWLNDQKKKFKNDKLNNEQINSLLEIGVDLAKSNQTSKDDDFELNSSLFIKNKNFEIEENIKILDDYLIDKLNN